MYSYFFFFCLLTFCIREPSILSLLILETRVSAGWEAAPQSTPARYLCHGSGAE